MQNLKLLTTLIEICFNKSNFSSISLMHTLQSKTWNRTYRHTPHTDTTYHANMSACTQYHQLAICFVYGVVIRL